MLYCVADGILTIARDLIHAARNAYFVCCRHGNDSAAAPHGALKDLLFDPAGLPHIVVPVLRHPHGPHELRHGIKDAVETVPAVNVLINSVFSKYIKPE